MEWEKAQEVAWIGQDGRESSGWSVLRFSVEDQLGFPGDQASDWLS
jgi:hypothetical protein